MKNQFWRTVGANQQYLDYRPNALPTELCRNYEVPDLTYQLSFVADTKFWI